MVVPAYAKETKDRDGSLGDWGTRLIVQLRRSDIAVNEGEIVSRHPIRVANRRSRM